MQMRALVLFFILAALPAMAANLRPMATLSAPVVRLSDLFDDAGENAARILGPGPAPGARIVVEAAQLAAIARQFGVVWKPASIADRAVLERPGKPVPREVVLAVLRAALTSAGVPEDSEMEVPPIAMPLIPFESQIRPVVTQLEHDSTSGGFTATLTLGGAEMTVVHQRLSGRVYETISVLVPIRRLQPGEVLRADELRPLRVRAAQLHADMARTPADAVGLTPRNALAAGQPMRLADLVRPPSVRKGTIVQMALNGGGLSLVMQALALESGAPGERVRVQNPTSRAVLEATVTGPDRVLVSPETMPVRPPDNATGAQLVLR